MDSKAKMQTKAEFTKEIREVLRALGLPQDQYVNHSFRIGAAMAAALAGVEHSYSTYGCLTSAWPQCHAPWPHKQTSHQTWSDQEGTPARKKLVLVSCHS